jgi:stage III sporulation protein AG
MVAMKKRLIYFASAVVATAFAASCAKEELSEGNLNKNENPEIEITGQVFEAKMEATKSVIDGKTPTWVEGDAISVFGSNETTGIECTFAGEGKFQVNGDKVVEGPFYAIYPHKEGHTVDQSTGIFTATVPAEQLIKAGENTAAGALVAVAASETPEFYFRNAVGLVRLENKREDIVSIKIESTNAEQMLAGSFTMDLNPDKDAENEAPAVTPATEGGSASVTLKSAEENGVLASGVYYAAILPGKIAGIKVTFTRKNGEKTETASKDTAEVFSEFEYEKELERRLKGIIEKIDGVGSVEVMVTLETSAVSSYAQDTNENINSDGDMKKETNIVLSSKSTSIKEPIVAGYKLPEVKGAAVVCEKHLSAALLQKVMGVVSASLGIATDKIYITN